MLSARGLEKRYGEVTALDGFDLEIREGEIVGLVGANGAGKSTFVEIVAGLVRPDHGQVRVGGLPTRSRSARALIGVAPQDLGLYLSLTVRENIRLFAGLHDRVPGEVVDELVEALRLTGVVDRQVGYLSGGQRRRTQAATALVHRPRLLLLDEPTAGADPTTRTALLELVREYAARGTAVCYTTHYLPELVELDATIAVVSAGRVIARGDQRSLLAELPAEDPTLDDLYRALEAPHAHH